MIPIGELEGVELVGELIRVYPVGLADPVRSHHPREQALPVVAQTEVRGGCGRWEEFLGVGNVSVVLHHLEEVRVDVGGGVAALSHGAVVAVHGRGDLAVAVQLEATDQAPGRGSARGTYQKLNCDKIIA